MIRSDLYDYSDTCILVSGTITIAGEGDDDAAKGADKRNKREIFQNCALFTEWERSWFSALRLFRLNLLESEMSCSNLFYKRLGSVSYYDFKNLPHSAFASFICESKGCVNTWMT